MLLTGDGNADRFSDKVNVTTNAAISAITDIRNGDLLSLQLMTTDSAGILGGSTAGTGLAGSWKIEVSNSYSGQPDQIRGGVASIGKWVDISADFDPLIPAATGVDSGQSWPVTANGLPYRHIQVTFTPSNGNTFTLTNKQRAACFLVFKSRSS